MDARSRGLPGEDLRFGGEQLLPARLHYSGFGNFAREGQEDLVVAELGEIEAAIEHGEFGIARFGGENGEALARADLDEGGDEQAIENLRRIALADEEAERIGVGILVD